MDNLIIKIKKYLADNQNAIDDITIDIKELDNKYIRLYSEFENYKRRNIKEKNNIITDTTNRIINDLLTTVDDLERSIKHINDNSPDKLGIISILDNTIKMLGKYGVKKIKSIGEPFNIDLHQAISISPVSDPNMVNIIIDEAVSGYISDDVVIRYASVVVGK